jgi:cytochrome P450
MYGEVLNLVSNAFCSVDIVDLAAESSVQGLREVVEDLVELIAKPNVSDLFPFLRPLDMQGCRRHAASQVAKVLRVLDGVIDRRLDEDEAKASSSSNKHGDFLEALLDLMSTGKITREDVTTIVFDMFVAGSDTIAITVEWAMAELLRSPSTMGKVRAEIKGAIGSKETIEESDAANLPYLHAVMKEAMRLHPVAPLLLPHQSTEDGVEVGGYAVPRGCTVIFNSWAMMRDPAAWERPDEFRPERFLDEAIEVVDFRFRGKDFEFLPFGSGRRVCPGVPMAERVVPFVLASLLHAFEWRLPDGMSVEQLDVSEKFTTANVMAVPLKAVPFVVLS